MNTSLKKGLGFGLVSGVITTLGLMTGLNAGTHLKTAILGGIMVIAVADAMSDALGMHMSEETDKKQTEKNIWQATLSTFGAKLLVALLFAVPVILLELNTAIMVNIGLGLSLIILFSLYLAKLHHISYWKAVGEHLLITIGVMLVTHIVGDLVAKMN